MRHFHLSFAIVFFCVVVLLASPLPASEAGQDPEGPALTLPADGTDAVLVIDVSGSMKVSDPDYLCKEAARTFIEDLRSSPGCRVALITFSDELNTVIELTPLDDSSQRNHLIEKLNSFTYTSGDTDIGAALEKAASLLAREDNTRTKRIFLLTDGEIDLPAAENEEQAEKESLTRALVAVEEAKTHGIVIHTVSLDLTGNLEDHLMKYAADSTGGTSSRVKSADALEDLFDTLSSYAARTETEAEQPEETTEIQTETEAETETEQIPPPVIHTIGSVDGPVHLKGLFPNQCKASLNLSDLFRAEGSGLLSSDSIRFSAWSDDSTMLRCTVEGSTLHLSGLRNGTGRIHVIAEIPAGEYGQEQNPDVFGDAVQGMGMYPEAGVPAESVSQAELAFTVEVDALLPSFRILFVVPVFAALTAALILLIRKRNSSGAFLSGSLQWHVRGENEKIFGMPQQTMAQLDDYGKKVRLSDLVQDELLDGSALHKVTVSGCPEGIVIESKSASCLIAAEGKPPQRRFTATHSARFKVLCETGNGTACVIAFYSADRTEKTEPSYEDDSEERTRLLV